MMQSDATPPPPKHPSGLLGQARRIKTPMMLQMESVECGAVALAIVLAYYGRWMPLDEMRLRCGVSRDGCNAANILKAARGLGMEARGFRKDLAALQEMPLPCIVFWNFNHFLVIEGFSEQGVYLNDPASGQRLVNWDEFELAYTGVVLTFATTAEFSKGGQPSNMNHLLRQRLRPHKGAFGFLFLIGLTMVLPGLAIPAFARVFVDEILIGSQQSWLWPLLLGMSGCALLRALLMYLQKHFLLKMESSIAIASSGQLFWHLLRLPIEFYTQRYAGEIGSRMAINDRVASMVAADLPQAVLNILTAMFFLAVMLSYDMLLACISLVFALANISLLQWVASRRKAMNQRLAITAGKVTGASMNGLSLMESLKASGAENQFFEKWAGYQAHWLQAMQDQARSSMLLNTLPACLVMLETTVIIGVGGLRVMDGALSLGMLVAFQSLAQSFATPIHALMHLGGKIQQMQGDLDRLQDVLRVQVQDVSVQHGSLPDQPQNQAKPETRDIPGKLQGHIELRNITFGYNRTAEPLLKDFSLSIRAGQRVALVGPSGCGKSTVSRLVMGLFQPWQGEVLLDGQARETWQRDQLALSLAMVDQDIVLFEGSVRDNLTLWDESVAEQAVIQAARDACMHEVILSRSGGYDSQVDEGGRNYSGGQRQRLEIARALVNEPRILVLDEATSALDPVAEKQVETNLRRRGCTCLIVAHRLSTVRDCDCIYVLQKGCIVEQGSHDELMQIPGGIYQQLAIQE